MRKNDIILVYNLNNCSVGRFIYQMSKAADAQTDVVNTLDVLVNKYKFY